MANANPRIEILKYSVDVVDGEVYLRALVNGKYFKYITVDAGLYNVDGISTKQPPTFPGRNWNVGHITKDMDTNKPCFAWTRREELPSIEHRWHPTEVDYLSLIFGRKFRLNVCEATSVLFPSPVIAKFATCTWEVEAYDHETEVYSWLIGHDIGPKFLGYVKEEERTIGFLTEKIEGRHATPEDIPRCRAELSKLHALNIIHGDVTKHNLFVSDSKVTIIDFECARRSDDKDAMAKELEQLEQQLHSTAT